MTELYHISTALEDVGPQPLITPSIGEMTPSERLLDQILYYAEENGESPYSLLVDLVTDVSDEDFNIVMGVFNEIENVVSNYHFEAYGPHEVRGEMYNFPDFTKTKILPSGELLVPYTDRKLLLEYLDSNEVTEALRHYFKCTMENFDDEVELVDFLDFNRIQNLSIEDLPETIESMDLNTLFALVSNKYLISKNDHKYSNPFDTLVDIAKEIPAELLVPMLNQYQESFPRVVDIDGRYIPIWRQYIHQTINYVEEGIVYQVITTEEVREALIDEFQDEAIDVLDYTDFNFEYFNAITRNLEDNVYDELMDDWQKRD